jgi:uncharacterized caspase-like protein
MTQVAAGVQTSNLSPLFHTFFLAGFGRTARRRLSSGGAKIAVRWVVSLFVAATVSIALAGSADAQVERRVALVIGNSAYQHSAPLENPTNDAQDLADALGRLGFEVILAKDLDKRGMEQSFSRFARLAQDADVAMFYYAGHALQYGGENFLVPIDATLQDEFSVEFEMARVTDVMNSLQRARGVKVLVLDACRNNPLAEQLARRATNREFFASRGLARIEHPTGMIVAYATQAGQVADDGRGRNSPFTSALIKRIEEPGVEIAQIFRRVAVDVNSLTKGQQVPDLSMSLLGEVYLSQPQEPKLNAEYDAWQKIAASNDRSEFEHFIANFPSSPFSDVAKERIHNLESKRMQQESAALALRTATDQATHDVDRDKDRLEQTTQVEIAKDQAVREQIRQQATSTAPKDTSVEQTQKSTQSVQTEKTSSVQLESTVKPDPVGPSNPATPASSDLAKFITHELRRVGCYRGLDTDNWQAGPKLGLEQYLRATKLNVSAREPSPQILEILKLQSGRICSPSCRIGETLANGQCVAKTCPAEMTLSASGKCVAAHIHEAAKTKSPEKIASRSLAPEPKKTRPQPHRPVYNNLPRQEDVDQPPPPRVVVPVQPRPLITPPAPLAGLGHLCLGVGPLALCR